MAQQVEHFLGKEKQAALTGAPNPSEIGTKLNMLLWLKKQAALTGAPNPSEIGTKLNMLLWLSR